MTPQDLLNTTMNFEAQLKKAKSMTVDAGVLREKAANYGDGTTVLDVAVVHEFGLGNSPARSFIRHTVAVKQDEIQAMIGKEFEKILNMKSDTEKSLGLVGIKAVNLIKGAFTSNGYGSWPPLKEETVRAKGSSQTLIDTGALRNSIHHRVNT